MSVCEFINSLSIIKQFYQSQSSSSSQLCNYFATSFTLIWDCNVHKSVHALLSRWPLENHVSNLISKCKKISSIEDMTKCPCVKSCYPIMLASIYPVFQEYQIWMPYFQILAHDLCYMYPILKKITRMLLIAWIVWATASQNRLLLVQLISQKYRLELVHNWKAVHQIGHFLVLHLLDYVPSS